MPAYPLSARAVLPVLAITSTTIVFPLSLAIADLRKPGEESCRNRVGRLMQVEGLRLQTGWRRKPQQQVMIHSDNTVSSVAQTGKDY